MAGRIAGITLEISGNTTKLQDALKDVDKSLKSTQTELKDVNKLLKLDPHNTELLAQKQQLLKTAISETKDRLSTLKDALKQMEAAGSDDPKAAEQMRGLKREIEATEQQLKGYKKQLKDLPGILDQVASASKKVSDETKQLSGAAAAVGGAMLANAYHSATAADDINTLAKQYSVGTDTIQKFNYASELVDVSTEDMLGSMAKLTKQMGSGNKAFEKLGVSIKDDVTGELRDSEDVWYDTLQALSQITNETERDVYAQELFGKSAASLSGIIDDGGAALKQMGDEAEDLGLILSQDALDNANKFNDGIDQLKARASQAFFEVGASLAESLLPMLEELVGKVTEVLQWFTSLDGDTQMVILTILGLVAAISPLAGLISSIATVASALAGAFTLLSGPIGIVIAVVAGLIAIGVALWQNWDTIKAKAEELWTKIKEVFDGIKSSIENAINTAKDTVLGAVEKIKGAFNFSWKLPELKLPHFSVTEGKFGLPNISVQWYKKAYDQGVLFDRPTVIPTADGFKGFGDGSGSEMVIGTNSLMGMIRDAAGADKLTHIESLLETIARNGTVVTLQGDARQMFKVVRSQNSNFRKATGHSGFDK